MSRKTARRREQETAEGIARWVENLASPTLTNDPFIRAADWAAAAIRSGWGAGQPVGEPCPCSRGTDNTLNAADKSERRVCMLPACGCDGRWHA